MLISTRPCGSRCRAPRVGVVSVDLDGGTRTIGAAFGVGNSTGLVAALTIGAIVAILGVASRLLGLQRCEDGRMAAGGVFTQALAPLIIHRHMEFSPRAHVDLEARAALTLKAAALRCARCRTPLDWAANRNRRMLDSAPLAESTRQHIHIAQQRMLSRKRSSVALLSAARAAACAITSATTSAVGAVGRLALSRHLCVGAATAPTHPLDQRIRPRNVLNDRAPALRQRRALAATIERVVTLGTSRPASVLARDARADEGHTDTQ